jgi:anthranilate phosphoribosyltransferase
MFAPAHHSAMKHVGPARVELGTRTAFNLLGPLSNPAGVKRQMTGVFARAWVRPIAEVLANLGTTAAWIVHGSDGLDEVTVTGETHVAELKNGVITTFTVTPEAVGLARHPAEALKGGDAAHNARALRAVLEGEPSAYRDIVLINTGAALVVAGKAATLADGVTRAAAAIDDGGARARLDALVAVSNS